MNHVKTTTTKMCPDYDDCIRLIERNGIHYSGNGTMTFLPTTLPGIEIILYGNRKYVIKLHGYEITNSENP